tara:strand:+ start:2103 stop:2459 length:357 start_codon:yes stop_codon:yes gene_type:complete
MSEDHAKYTVSTAPPALRPGTLLRFTDAGYQAPGAQDVRTLKAISGKTGRELTELVGIADQRTFRKWTAPEGASQRSQIPYAAWRLLLIELGLVPETNTPTKDKGANLAKARRLRIRE